MRIIKSKSSFVIFGTGQKDCASIHKYNPNTTLDLIEVDQKLVEYDDREYGEKYLMSGPQLAIH